MKRYNYILFCLFILFFGDKLHSQGGDTPAQALASPSIFPFTSVSGTTIGKLNDVTTTATGLPTGFPTTYISGLDYFYYFCPGVTQNITVTLNYTPTSSTVSPSLLIWDGIPGVAGSTVVSSIYSSGDNSEVMGTLSTAFNATSTKCYYVMVDNWPTPNGFAYTISANATTIGNGCTNIGFESNSFADWYPTYGHVDHGNISPPAATTVYNPLCSSSTMPTALALKPQHSITSSGNDLVIPSIPMVCPLPGLGSHSLKLGDGNNANGNGATIEQTFAVTTSNAMFSYYYAVIMKYYSSHKPYEQPMFKISITDENGANITCADYLVVANSTDPTFLSSGTTYYKNWTPVFVDLSNYIGTNVKIKYEVRDCAPDDGGIGSHYCYAYIDATCSSVTKATTVNACSGVSTVLNAPMGGKTYSWTVQGSATVVGTGATLTVVPTTNTIYECTITSVTNCVTTTTVTLNVTPTPIITNPGTQTACDSYTLPTIAGTSLTGNQKYYTNSQALGGTQITGPITSTQTVWIYDINGTCPDEESFLVKIRKTPLATVNSPFSCSSGSTTMTATVTPTAAYSYSWVYPVGFSNPGDVASFNTTIPGTYTVTVSNANLVCSSDFEDALTFAGTSTSILVSNASSPCWKSTAVSSPRVEFWKTTAYSGNQYIKVKSSGSSTVFQNFTATPNSEVTLSFAHKRSASSGTETMTVEIGPVGGPYVLLGTYNANTANWTPYTVNYLIPSNAVSTYTIRFNSTVASGTSGNCLDAVSLSIIGCPATPAIGIFTTNAITLNNPGPQTACDSYTLPTITGTNLSGNQKYYTNSQALGGTVITGPITSTQTVWIYDSNGTCSDEESFLVTINTPPVVNVSSSTICNGGTAAVTATVNPAGIYKYTWTVPTGVTNPGNVASFTTNIAGNYSVEVTNTNVLCINDFEIPVITSSGANKTAWTEVICWKTTASDGQIELWKSGGTRIAVQGTQFAELNANFPSTLYQEGFTFDAGTKIEVSFSHRGRDGVDVMKAYIGPPMPVLNSGCALLGTYTTGNTAWSNYTATYTIPSTGIYSLRFESVSATGGATQGNFLDAISIIVKSCPILPATGTVTLVSNPTASISPAGPICSGTGTDITFNGTPNGKVTYKIGTGANQIIYLNSAGTATLATGNLTSNTTYNLVSIEVGTAPVCSQNLTGSVTINVNPDNTVNTSTTPTTCINTALATLTHTTTGATAIATTTTNYGLPTGVSAVFTGNATAGTITISGNPSVSGTFNYTIPLTGGCGAVNAIGTITVNQNNTVTASTNPTLCINTVMTTFTHTTTGATAIATTTTNYGLPTGVSAVFTGNATTGTITISGNPSVSGTFNYSIPLIGGCGTISATGTITIATISINNPGPQTVCDSYTLPTITGTGLSGNQKYYNNSQAASGTVITGPITSTQTVWIYDINGSCSDEKSFLVTINKTPIITNPGAQTICDSYTLPTINGTNLTGNQKYYNNSQALSGTQISGTLTTSQTVWIYDAVGSCKDEESFLVTINNTPTLTNPGAQTVCDSYTLPVIVGSNLTGGQKYYNNSQALGGTVITGSITTTQTVWIYDAQGTCKDEKSFLVTVNKTPSLNIPGTQTVCDSYDLPSIIGTNLTGNEKYYNNSQALGGTVITGPVTSTQTVWIYDAVGACKDQESFLVTIIKTPVISSNPGGLFICSSYTLPVITGTDLTGGQKYYNNSQALGGMVITGPITSTKTIWIYDNNLGCKDEESFLVTINTSPPTITNPGPQNVCDSYTLPSIIGTNLTGNQKYYNNSQALGGTQISGTLTTNQTIWLYDSQGTCQDEKSFILTIHTSPVINNPGFQTVCDSYTLPIITGTNLSGNQKYYTNSQALGGTVITGPITSTQTIWIYDLNGICSDEESFLVTVNHTPSITNPGPQTVCDSYSLPTIIGSNLTGNQKYYNNSQALGGTQITGPITSTQTVWIYDAQGACNDEKNFLVTILLTPSITNPGPQTVCDSYSLPVITGTNLSGSQKYYTNSQALGGTQISGTITSSQTVWIYDTQGNCSDEESFLVTVNQTPIISNPGAQIVCDSYSLPVVSGTNLTGNQKFYNNTQALGATQISGSINTTQTIWIYDAEGNCSDEESFLVTVNQTPIITNPGAQTVCDSYTLPSITGTNLTGTEKYFSNSQALSGTQITGAITSTQTVWIFDTEGTCSDEESFLVTVNQTPIISNPGAQIVCDSYSLPVISGTNLTGNQKFYTNTQALSGMQISGSINTTQTVWIYDAEGNCSDEESFVVTVNYTPVITNPGPQTVCDSYALPTIFGTNLTGGQKYYNNSQVLGGTPITGPITSTQTVWIYDAQGNCSDEESFVVTVNYTPSLINPGDQTICDSYTLPTILGTNLSSNQKYYNNSQASGGTSINGPITSTQRVWIYDANGNCSDEESFLVTIHHTPILNNLGDQTVCDSYMLPVITGTNLTGGQKYYTNSQALGGTTISGAIISTQTIWMYDLDGICPAEVNFKVTVYHTPSITNPGNKTVCDTYTLPTITGVNLTGGQKYYNNSQALGGTVITGPLTNSQTIWMYDIDGICSDEKSYTITINHTPNFVNPGPQVVCDIYTLPTVTGTNLSGNQNLFNNSQALGGSIINGTITSTQTVWIYDINGACPNEESFLVTVNLTPTITNPGNVTVCDSYDLPVIDGSQLSGNQKYYNNSHALNGSPINGPITLTQTVWLYDEQGSCTDETSFVVTVNHTPNLTNPGDKTVCDAYLLPVISGSNLTGNEKFYTNSQAGGGTPIFGMLTTSQTVWMYDIDGACSDEESFVITINISPTVKFTPDKTSGCVPLTVKFTNTSTPLCDEITWDFGDGNTSTSSTITNEIIHTFTSVDCFEIELTATSKGCKNSLSLSNLICTYPIPVASFTTDQDRASILNPVINFNNTSTVATFYNWMFGDGEESIVRDPSHTFPGDKGTFQVILVASTANGCSDTAYRMIEIYDELIFYIPNTFTPENDQYNQVFTPIFNAGYDPQNFTMHIFNRWGEIIFETHDSTIGWEGMYGKEEKLNCQDGLYIWKISYTETKTGDSKTIVGDVILIR